MTKDEIKKLNPHQLFLVLHNSPYLDPADREALKCLWKYATRQRERRKKQQDVLANIESRIHKQKQLVKRFQDALFACHNNNTSVWTSQDIDNLLKETGYFDE